MQKKGKRKKKISYVIKAIGKKKKKILYIGGSTIPDALRMSQKTHLLSRLNWLKKSIPNCCLDKL
jgi:hypothetical protein